jgi:pyruvyltransferase
MSSINVFWYNPINGSDKNNWGDLLNKTLIEKISRKKVVWINHGNNLEKYICIGSILQRADSGSIIWGAGFLSSSRKLSTIPKQICAVRGKLSRDIILKQGIDCPEVYGDPALLYPKYYNPLVKKKYKLGIIPHYVDANNDWFNYNKSKEILKIDILSGINNVVDQILSCEMIASSSLHGLIAADAYGIKSKWVEFSDKVLGNGFKFHDYYSSVNREHCNSLKINKDTTINEIINSFEQYDFNIDLRKLFNACPFKQIS